MSDLEDALLARYGTGYAPDTGGDEIYGTEDIMRMADAHRLAKEREPYEALTRLLTMWGMPVATTAHRASTSSNLPKAISYHNRLEQRTGNDLVNPVTKPFLSSVLGLMTPGMARAMAREEPTIADKLVRSPIGRALDRAARGQEGWKGDNLLAPHINNTAVILNMLNQMSARAPQRFGYLY